MTYKSSKEPCTIHFNEEVHSDIIPHFIGNEPTDQHRENEMLIDSDCNEKENVDQRNFFHDSKDNQNLPLLHSNLIITNDSSEDENLFSNLNLLGINDSSSTNDEFSSDVYSDDRNFSIDDSLENVYENSENLPNTENTTNERLLKEAIRDWALKFHITLVALSALLLLLEVIFNVNLPVDGRTLLGTLKICKVTEIKGRTYHHFGLQRAIKNIL